MTGYERPAGEIWFGGDGSPAAPGRVFALGLGRTFQMTRLFPRLTLLENMLVRAPSAATGHWRALLARAGRCRGHAPARPAGVRRHGPAGRHRAGTLSYGQRKLLELAHVLVPTRP